MSNYDPAVIFATERYVRRVREASTTEDYLDAAQELGNDVEVPGQLQGLVLAAALSIVAKEAPHG